jgi:hypothetical protein
MRLYLTGFLNRIFSGEIALNRVFCRGNQQPLPAFTTAQLTGARAPANPRFADAIFTFHPDPSQRRQPLKTAGIRFRDKSG